MMVQMRADDVASSICPALGEGGLGSRPGVGAERREQGAGGGAAAQGVAHGRACQILLATSSNAC